MDVHTALKDVVNINVYGASSIDDHGKFVFKNDLLNPPSISEPDFINRFNQLLTTNNIDVIIPCHDSVVEFLTNKKEAIKAVVASSCSNTAKICRYKTLTYKALEKSQYCPQVFSSQNAVQFPVFIKPDAGQGAKNTHVANNRKEFDLIMQKNDLSHFVVTEFLPGMEFTVDCFTDRNGILRFVGPRTRARILAGISVRSETVGGARFEPIAHEINNSISFRGLWYFQVKEDCNGQLKIMEISARAAGTMNVYRQRGVNLPLLTVHDALGHDISILDSGFKVVMDRCLHAKYAIDIKYDTVYLDFDDTLVRDLKVNPVAITFVYQCINKKIDVHLITKHEKDLDISLKNAHLSKSLFTSIIHIPPTELKSDHIQLSNAIFIDNAFSERKEVFEKTGIPVFDVDAIQCLIDWKE